MIQITDCTLRPLQKGDLHIVLQWRNSPRIRSSMFTDKLITREDHKAWFERIKQDPDVLYFLFEYQNVPVGVVNFTCQSRHSSRYVWGFYLGETSVPHGTGSAMGYLALQHIFEMENAHKVSGEVLCTNEISLHFHEKLGFAKEGRMYQHVLKNDVYLDVILFSLLADTWQKRKTEIHEKIFE